MPVSYGGFQDYSEATKTPWQQIVAILGGSILMRQLGTILFREHLLTDEQEAYSNKHGCHDHNLLHCCLLLTHQAVNVTLVPASCPYQPV